MRGARIDKLGLLGLVLRSFYLQSAWNYDGLQAQGFAHVIFPVGRRLSSESTVSRDFAARHLALFNTNPILASYVIGAVTKLEEEVKAGRRQASDVESLKTLLAVPLAAAGDRFFWANLRPVAGTIGVMIALFYGAAGAFALMAAYNVFHVYYRVRGVVRGYALGTGTVVEVSRLRLVQMSDWLGRCGAFSLGALLVTLSRAWGDAGNSEALVVFPAIAIVCGVLPESFHKRITEIALIAGALGVVLTAGAF
ncbi:MAG: PTS system mannose/fructose/sorbose family transporter subunit IID [Candidatus Eisenbacteria bacterium]